MDIGMSHTLSRQAENCWLLHECGEEIYEGNRRYKLNGKGSLPVMRRGESVEYETRKEWHELRKRHRSVRGRCSHWIKPITRPTSSFGKKRPAGEPEDISDKPYVKYGTEAEKHLRPYLL